MCIRERPNNWDYQLNYGTLLFKMGDLNESLSYLKNVVKVNKWHYASHYNLGQLLSRLGKKDEANKYLSDHLRIMDSAAISVARENKIPIIVFESDTISSDGLQFIVPK